MIAEFTPIAPARRGNRDLRGDITLASVAAPYVTGSVIENAATALDGYQTGYLVCGLLRSPGASPGCCSCGRPWIRPGSGGTASPRQFGRHRRLIGFPRWRAAAAPALWHRIIRIFRTWHLRTGHLRTWHLRT